MRLFAARQVGQVCSDLFRFVQVWSECSGPVAACVLSGRGGCGWSDLVGFVQVCSGCSGPVAACVLSGRGGFVWSGLVGFVQVCSGCLGPVAACVLSGRGGLAWSDLVGAVRICTGLFGFVRGASLRRGGRRWTSVGLLFCCVGRRYHGVGGMGRGAALGAVLGEIPAASAGMTEEAAGMTAGGASDGGG